MGESSINGQFSIAADERCKNKQLLVNSNQHMKDKSEAEEGLSKAPEAEEPEETASGAWWWGSCPAETKKDGPLQLAKEDAGEAGQAGGTSSQGTTTQASWQDLSASANANFRKDPATGKVNRYKISDQQDLAIASWQEGSKEGG